MQYEEAVIKLDEFLGSEIISNNFGTVQSDEVIDNSAPIISEENVHLPKDGVGHKSGIYMIYSASGEIYYIGKATKNNLHEEVWGKIKTPSKNSDGSSYYPKNYFLNKNKLDQSAVSDITNGNVKIGVHIISNNILASLVEVYLQTLYCQISSGKLPKLNSQIG